MDKNKDNIAVSALYTAATWRWAGFGCAEFVTPANAEPVFKLVNAFMLLYRMINPRKFSLRHQLLHRHSAIDYLLWHSGYRRVVEVACGLSARGSRFSANPDIEYIEMDLPDMVDFKRRQLGATEAGREVLMRPNFILRSADIFSTDFAVEFPGPALAVITEGLMMYFPRDKQMRVWRSIAELMQRTGGVYLFDYIPLSDEPERSWLGKALHVFKEKVLGLHADFAYDGRSRDDVARDLEAAGFDRVEVVDTGEIARPWALPSADVPSRTLIYACYAGKGEH